MTCTDCERLRNRLKELEETLEQRDELIAELKLRLKLYENSNTPPSLRRYPTRVRSSSYGGRRFPGRPRGYPGKYVFSSSERRRNFALFPRGLVMKRSK